MTRIRSEHRRNRQRTNLRDRLCTPEPECEEKSVAVERS
jgi:hypothetical protein